MPSFDLSFGANRIRKAVEDLQRDWAETTPEWDDANSRNMEKNHLEPLLVELTNAMGAIQRLSDALSQAERECAPWEDVTHS